MYKQLVFLILAIGISNLTIAVKPRHNKGQANRCKTRLFVTKQYFTRTDPNRTIYTFNKPLAVLSMDMPITKNSVTVVRNTVKRVERASANQFDDTKTSLPVEQGFPTPYELDPPRVDKKRIKLYSHVTTADQRKQLVKEVRNLYKTSKAKTLKKPSTYE